LNTGLAAKMCVFAAILARWLFSSAGIWRIFLKTGKPGAVAFVPFWRLGQLAEVADARAQNAWWLLVPGVNLIFWVKLNQYFIGKRTGA
jgi:hypothetical protein